MQSKDAKSYATGLQESCKYFQIPFGWTLARLKKKKEVNRVARCQRVDLPDRTVFIYTIQKCQ